MIRRYFLGIVLTAMAGATASAGEPLSVSSPDGDITLTFELTPEIGAPTYSVDFKGREVIAPSHLGLELVSESGRNTFDHQAAKAKADALSLTEGFVVYCHKRDTISETWNPVWGEETEILNRYNSLSVTLLQPALQREMVVEFRVFDDGIAFRYDFPTQPNLNYFVIKEELSQFAMPGDLWAYWIPGDYDTQEYNYTKSRLSEIRGLFPSKVNPDNASTTTFSPTGVQTSLQLKSDDGIYLNIHEAATVDYPTMHLNLNPRC